jgi:calcium uniporter protein, mitochondrial
MAFHRTMARRLWAGKNSGAPKAAAPVSSAPRRPLPAVEDCPTLASLRPRPANVRYTTLSVPLPARCFPALPVGDQLFNRLRLDGLVVPRGEGEEEAGGVTVEQARKVARAAEMEAARERLRRHAQSVVSMSEFAALCADAAGGVEGGRRLARALDESAVVIVLGDAVFLRPDMVARAIGSVLPTTGHADERRAELAALEAQKAAIDAAAAAQARSELWCGLGLLAAQTLGSMRLTFWELSWDVMEPVCFYVASLYFVAGYAFFMRTAAEPSFQGFFRARFAARQRRLMRARRFDLHRYNALIRDPPVPAVGRKDRHLDGAVAYSTEVNTVL